MSNNRVAQILTITTMNLQNISKRKASSLSAIIGIACVVAILVGVLSIREGFRATLDRSGATDVAVVLRVGSDSEMSSGLSYEETRIIGDADSVVRENGLPLVSPELFVTVDVPLRSTGTPANVPFRGVATQAAALRQNFEITEGRMFTSGKFELIAGTSAAREFSGLSVGNTVHWGTTDWHVVGLFNDGGSVSESEVWTDVNVLQGAYNRGNTFQSMRVKLGSPEDLAGFKDDLSTIPHLNVRAMSEREYYSQQSKSVSRIISSIGYFVALLMGIGAIFGALNTMYSAISNRAREIATLRALGFGGAPVIVSVLTESMILGLIGGVAGCALAYLGFNNIHVSTLNFTSSSQVAFAFSVTPALLINGLFYSLILAFIGGVIPGLKAIRQPIVSGLRQL